MDTKKNTIAILEHKFGYGCVQIVDGDAIYVLHTYGWVLLCHTYTPEYYKHLEDARNA